MTSKTKQNKMVVARNTWQ